MNVLIAADFFISEETRKKCQIDESITRLFEKSDFRILNLEAPITENISENRILKTGPHLRAAVETTMPYLILLKVSLVTLANNHIMDYGEKGLRDTINTLKGNGINYVGVGNNINEAGKFFSLLKEGTKVAILNFAENEWSTAKENQPGANPLDIIDNVNQIKAAKATHDKVICIIHGGHELYNLPSPRMVKLYRFFIDNGADAILNHHQHCYSGYELYKECPIFYGLGNFCFEYGGNYHMRNEGYLVDFTIKGNKLDFQIYPYRSKDRSTISLLNDEHSKQFYKNLVVLNNIIADNSKLKDEYENFLTRKSEGLKFLFEPYNNRLLRVLYAKKLLPTFFDRRKRSRMLAILQCESHRDELLFFLKDKNTTVPLRSGV